MCRTEKPNKEINKSMKPDKANQKPKGKECTFETQITIKPIETTQRVKKKNPSTGFKLEIGNAINLGDGEVRGRER